VGARRELDETTASQRRVGKIRGSLTGRRESSSLFARRLNEAGQGEDRESACARDFSNCRAHYVRGMQNWGCSSATGRRRICPNPCGGSLQHLTPVHGRAVRHLAKAGHARTRRQIR
jgi:hypothetical protein